MSAFAVVIWTAIRTTLLTQQQQLELNEKQTREALQQFLSVWEQGVDSQLLYWDARLKDLEDLPELEKKWQRSTPWLDGIYLWKDGNLIYPEVLTDEVIDSCLDSSPELINCSNANLQVQNRASLIRASYWMQEDQLEQAQFALLSAIPQIRAPLSEHDLSLGGQTDFILRRVRLFQTEQLGAPLNGGQALLSEVLSEMRHLAPYAFAEIKEDLPQFLNPEMELQVERLERRLDGWNFVQDLMASKPNNEDFETLSRGDSVLTYKQRTADTYMIISLDVPTLIDTLITQTGGIRPLVLNADGTTNHSSGPIANDRIVQIPGPKFFPQLRVGLTVPENSEGIRSQIILTLAPILLAGLLGGIAIIGSIRADRRQLELVNRQQAFIARVTHELKTPLAGIQLMAQSLEMMDTTDETQPFIEKIVHESQRLEQRIDEILQVAKQAEIRRRQRIDTEVLMLELFDLWAPRFQEAHGKLRLEPTSIEVEVDVELLKDAITNLLSNSIKYRHPLRPLRCIFSMKDNGKWLEISVADNGIGVPISERKRIFERFVRVEGNNRGFAGGHGLGLAFVSETANAHKGTVKCYDGIQGGTRFVLRLPVINR